MQSILPGECTPEASAGRGTAAVTGAAGFIGSHLVDLLLAQGHRVLGLDSLAVGYSAAQKRANLREATANPRFRLVVDDIRRARLAESLSGVDTVYHLAAKAGVQDSWHDSDIWDVNVAGAQAVLSAALTAGARRVVLASSSSVYGDSATAGGARALSPTSPYGATKAACEHLADIYARRGLDVVVLRYFTVFGPRQRPDMAMHRIIESTRPQGPAFCRRGTGEQTREYTYVSDVAAATLAAGTASRAAGRTLDIGGGCRHSLNEVIAAVTAIRGTAARVRGVPSAAGDPQATVADGEQARLVLDWAPATGLHQGLAEQAAWHRRAWAAPPAQRDHDPAATSEQNLAAATAAF
ncbi:MAG: NAD-dependent epimerase/dehydratase family protein [Acidimicrobiaceae bacterium]|nr:NAD-dependent epimerase/dehydratase family protein [Acidimicrobiaceae bacterium]